MNVILIRSQCYLISIKCKINRFSHLVVGIYQRRFDKPWLDKPWKICHWIDVFQMGFWRDQMQVSSIKFSFIYYWKSKDKSNANKFYGWYKVWQNIASRAAMLSKLVGHKHKLSLDVRVPARSESTMRSCIGWGCSPAPVPRVLLPWHANLSEQEDMLALLLGYESISFHGYVAWMVLLYCVRPPMSVFRDQQKWVHEQGGREQ